MNQGTDKLLQYLSEVEEVAEDILTDKNQLVDLDRKRNKNREALRALDKEIKADQMPKKSLVCFGNMFIKFPKETAKKLITDDQAKLEKEVTNLRNGLKHKISKLRELEGKSELSGFSLQPLSREEMCAVEQFMKPCR
ncbi:p53 and DNA damage-regulated protein 1-like [Limulus polyphemus]|uniref:P53 and DNA damage-regulated protein 1-like n=1 Tax=Limulus polyphemus TaxID=6850 RepID=A0ABM1BGD6_LIMPO|nr:p53 and DNA damage-regulated protein 1-like [Limulus polyphemus]XP_022249421.1 p53 and DNA damage-regulated protein 1-like [Limulus polyphemus]